MTVDPRLKRLSPVILALVLALAAGLLFGRAALDWISGGENLSSARTAISATALLSIYAAVSENGLVALRGLLEYIQTGSSGPGSPGLFTPMVKLTAVVFLVTCGVLLYSEGDRNAGCGAEGGDQGLTETRRLNCKLEALEGSVATLANELPALRDDLRAHSDATTRLLLDNVAAFPLVYGNARPSNGDLDENSDGIPAEQAVNFERLSGAVNTIAEVVESRTRPDCQPGGQMRVVVSGYASEVPFAGFANSDDLNLKTANMRAELVGKALDGMLREKKLGDFVAVKTNSWQSYEFMRAGRLAFDEDAARLEETDHWLIGRSVFVRVGELPECFAVPPGETRIETISN